MKTKIKYDTWPSTSDTIAIANSNELSNDQQSLLKSNNSHKTSTMKQIKIVLSLIVVLSFTGNAIGQHIGIQAGGLLSNIKWRNELYTVNTFTKAGAMGGITLDIPLKNDMVFNTALNYKYMGTVIKDSSALGSMRFGFINLDLTYCYLFDMKTFQIYIEGGGYVGYMVNASRVDKPEGEDEEVTDLEIGTSSDDQIKPWDMGLSIGGGVYLNK